MIMKLPINYAFNNNNIFKIYKNIQKYSNITFYLSFF